MIGLEYVCKIFKKEQKELAEKLKISPPNISTWLKGTREIPTKYLPELSKIFNGISSEYFQKELSYADELKIRIYHIESMSFEERYEEFTVGALDNPDELIIDEQYDLHEDELKFLQDELAELKSELNKTLIMNSYQERINLIFERVWLLENKKRTELFQDKNSEDFLVSKLNSYLDFMLKLQIKDISAIDLMLNYFANYQGIEQGKWGEQEVFPNEKLLAFYKDLEEVLDKHRVN
jgi:transcriptional regulator with XRE-family HTH domain